MSVDGNHAVRYVVQAHKQARQRAFARTGAPQYRQRLARLHMHRHIFQHRHGRLVGIGKGQVFNADIALERLNRRVHHVAVHDFRLRVKNLLNTAQARQPLADARDALAHRHHRPHQHRHIRVEADKLPDVDFAVNRQIAAVSQRQQTRYTDNQIQQRHHQRLQAHNAEVLFLREQRRLRKSVQLLAFLHEGFNHADARHRFLHLVRQRRERLLLGQKALVHHLAVEVIAEDDENQRQHRHTRQFRADIRHHLPQHQQQHHRRVECADDVHAHQRANRLQVVDEARHQVAGLVLVVIVRRERG